MKPLHLDYYYWNAQCPISEETIALLKRYQNQVDYCLFDVWQHSNLAVEQRMFFPFLTVVNHEQRLFAPLSESRLQKLLEGDLEPETPYVITQSAKVFHGQIVPLTEENSALLTKKCCLTGCETCSRSKLEFLGQINDDPIHGFLNLKDDVLVGGVEYVPSLQVPYDIPKSESTAFITCVYHSSTEWDFKSAPLKRLEEYLTLRYTHVLAISDENGTFPNGDLAWFMLQDYRDEGVISVEKDYCRLHLVSKVLK